MGATVKTILVVDDEENIRDLATMYLQKEGFAVITAVDGEEGLEAARLKKPDLVVLDVMMPRMDGLDVCRALRRESDVPVLIPTARSDDIDRIVGLELGADDYMGKPFNPRELTARVKAILRRAEGGNTREQEAGEFRLQREPVDPGELLTDVADVFSQRAEEKGIALRVEADNALPTLALDFDRLVQVLGNLVDNAVRHTAEGGIVLSRSISADGQAARLVVGDTGEGIAPEDLAHLFERFYRGSSTAQRRGTGLGLAIAREIVRAHGGEIDARSTPAEGTEFVITLPIEAKAPDG